MKFRIKRKTISSSFLFNAIFVGVSIIATGLSYLFIIALVPESRDIPIFKYVFILITISSFINASVYVLRKIHRNLLKQKI